MNWEIQEKDLSKIALAIVALIALVLILSNIHHLEEAEGIDFGGAPPAELSMVISELLYALWIAFFIYIIIKSFKPKVARKFEGGGGTSTTSVFLGFLILIAVIIVIRFFAGDPGGADGGAGGGPDDGGEGIVPGGGDDVAGIAGLLLPAGLIVIVSLVALYIFLQHRPQDIASESRGEEDAREIFERAMVRLDDGEDFENVILTCYSEMYGLLRSRMEKSRMESSAMLTPREFSERATRELGLPREELNELTLLFEEARYSRHEISERMEVKAKGCLERIMRVLEETHRTEVSS